MLYNKNNYVRSSYLLALDHGNKYNIKSIYDVPLLDQIIIKVSLSEFLSVNDNSSLKNGISLKQIRTLFFFLIYSFSALFPLIKNADLIKEGDNNYYLQIIYKDSGDINNFLKGMFVENWNKFEKLNLNFLNDLNSLKCNNNQVICQIFVPISSFFDVNENFLYFVPGFNTRKFSLNITYIFEKKVDIKNLPLFIKNFNLFWIGC